MGTALSALEEIIRPHAAEHRHIDEHAADVDEDNDGDGGDGDDGSANAPGPTRLA